MFNVLVMCLCLCVIYESENSCLKNIQMIVIRLVFPLCGSVSSFIQQFKRAIFRCPQIAAICGSENGITLQVLNRFKMTVNLNYKLTGCKYELVLAIPNKNHLLVHHHQQQFHHLPYANIYQFVLKTKQTFSNLQFPKRKV